MRTIVERAKRTTFMDWAATVDLTMRVVERETPNLGSMQFYASFDRCETKDGGILSGTFGNGATPTEAIADYARLISGKLLVFNAYGEDRREIRVPKFLG